jgi:hypothetical protein
LGNHFYWYIAVECEDKQTGKIYAAISEKFKRKVADVCVAFFSTGLSAIH